MTRLHLVRHGETDWNLERRYQGSKDIPLNDRGRLQAKELAEKLIEMPFAGIYSSNLKRAFETASILRGSRSHVIEQFPQLQEGTYGSLEGKTFKEIEEQFGNYLFGNLDSLSNLEKLNYKLVPDMESGYEVAQRVVPILEILAKKHPEEEVLIVTHGGVMRCLLVYLAHCEWSKISIKNAQLVTFDYKDGSFKLHDNSKLAFA